MHRYMDPTQFAYQRDLAIAEDPQLAKHYHHLLKRDPSYLESLSASAVDSNGNPIPFTRPRSIWVAIGIFILKYIA